MFCYEKSPDEIYRQSFEIIRAEAELSGYSAAERQLVVRLIHACGMVDLTDDIVLSAKAVKAGMAAIRQGAPIICDVEMVRRGIIKRHLGDDNGLLCGLGMEKVAAVAKQAQTTRTAAGIEMLKAQIPGSILAIGNAPTALFHLLELVQKGLAPPAVIIGCPVGFVGAVESKEALIGMAGDMNDVELITVRGRRGGSAMAAAAVNALAILAREDESK